ncbi:MAG: hypothetical protein ND895_24685 [Pyrinomonadaceae bacterium]|nr:hypothetical protein [Pyrinomonadaceae bacterium]
MYQNRNHGPLIAQNHLSNARRRHAKPELTGLIAFDDRDVGVPDFLLDATAVIMMSAAPVRSE